MSMQSTALSGCETSAPSGGSMTIEKFCQRNEISRSFYYQLKKHGLGPSELRYRTAVRITYAAESAWQKQGAERARAETA
jgi:hypothetical protein